MGNVINLTEARRTIREQDTRQALYNALSKAGILPIIKPLLLEFEIDCKVAGYKRGLSED